ncbi:MAG: Ldh family oxidoreductase [Firmicutes bacterium]|nr:Ldh family oxidoreductase [Bacillota bacterium]
MDSIRVDAGQLISFCAEALRQTGLSPDDARVAAEVIVECDMREVSSHGVVALPHYIRQMQKGGIDVKAKLTIEREGPSFALVNANAGVGQLTGYKAAKLAMEKARQAGVGVVAVKNSNHYGAGASYALMCAREGMIGEAFSNAPPTMSITGGRGRNIGNNPYAMAAPAGRHDPVVLDMAMSVVAAGKIVNCAAAGQPIPEGWMLSKDGLPTTNPDDFLAGGALIPFGGYKGYGLAMFVEILAGVLSGAGLTDEMTSWRLKPDVPTLTGHFIQAINIEAFMPLDEFKARMDRLIDKMHNAPKAPGCERIYVPGELENIAYRRAQQEGVLLARSTFNGLANMAADLGIDFPFKEYV